MARFAISATTVVLAGCIAMAGQTPARAQPAQKLAKPLDLTEFTKSSAARQKRSTKVAVAPSQQPELTTGQIAKTAAAPAAAAAAAAAAAREEPAARTDTDAARFCKNIADTALDARVAWQQKELETAEARLRQRIAELEAKRAEYEEWLKRREDFLKKAEDSVVDIYSRMNPDAAAQQIASMSDDTAAAVLAKLRARNASAILNEMEPGRGAQLADTLAGMRRADDGKSTQ
ncbi:MotE family protein [Rhodopseudomonas sp. NSM]|uniref:MotE family protein n=1 Tax=Rhodopseudomonas sp. NSM TaxID=3457630 RepID=UPI004036D31F